MEIVTYLDLLYLCLSMLAIALTILLSVSLIRLIKLLWHIENITKTISTLLGLANSFMIKPVQILTMVLDYVWKALNKKN